MAQLSDKNALRKWAKEVRNGIDIEAIGKLFVKKIKDLDEYKSSKNVMIFYPLKDEINLLELAKDNCKNFYLPKIEDKNLVCCSYKYNDELCESCFKTKEPLTESTPSETLDLIIVPALAVDKNHYRLGYGGGYYDRFLKGLNAKRVVCIPKQLLIETIYPDKFDIPVDIVITD